MSKLLSAIKENRSAGDFFRVNLLFLDILSFNKKSFQNVKWGYVTQMLIWDQFHINTVCHDFTMDEKEEQRSTITKRFNAGLLALKTMNMIHYVCEDISLTR